MANSNRTDPPTSVENAVEVDAKTAAAIQRGLREASDGRVVSSEEVRRQVAQWISKFSASKTL